MKSISHVIYGRVNSLIIIDAKTVTALLLLDCHSSRMATGFIMLWEMFGSGLLIVTELSP